MVEFTLLMWFVVSVAIGLWNHDRGNGFLTGFLISLLLSPVVGFFITIFTKPRRNGKKPRKIRKR